MRAAARTGPAGGLAGLALLGVLALVAMAGPAACPAGALEAVGPPLAPPATGRGAALWLGTDDLGRSVACLVAHGLRASAGVGIGAGGLAMALGLALGLAAGARGGAWDAGLSLLIAGFQVLPRFLLALVVVALFGPSAVLMVLVLGLTSWTLPARIARAEAMRLARLPFVQAARALGAGPGRILWRHVLPNALPPLRGSLPVVAGGAVAAEAGLGFLGLGAPETVSLGRLVAEAYPFWSLAPWMSLAPIAALSALVLGIAAASGAMRAA